MRYFLIAALSATAISGLALQRPPPLRQRRRGRREAQRR